MKIKYKKHKFEPSSLRLIAQANAICEEYAVQGFDLTLRQLYYQFVARGLLENKIQNYKRLGNIINDARMAGLVDWDYIADRTRNLRGLPHWADPQNFLDEMVEQFRHDKWKDQPTRIEVWVEKDALIGVLQAACNPEDVPFFSCRGYPSVSEIWEAAQRYRRYIDAGQRVVILHLGDHDPSGVDMTRDIDERLWLIIATDLMRESGMSREEATDAATNALTINRIALNMNQIQRYNPPPNPAKFKDPRSKGYVRLHGHESWELDALPPDVLVNLIRTNIRRLRDDDAWRVSRRAEFSDKKLLRKVKDYWQQVSEFVGQFPSQKDKR